MKAMLVARNAPIEESPLALSDVPLPEPSDGEILVRVNACAICRTDLHVIEGELRPVKLPVIPGHQAVGVVARRGAGARRFRDGERVGIAWLRETCGKCSFCAEGMENLCDGQRFTGYHADGGYAEYAVVREDFAYAIPGAFSDVDASPLLCAGIIGFRALRRSRLEPGRKLGIYGFGSSAHIVMQIARHWGCTVFVSSLGERHRRHALEMGASFAGGASEDFPEKADSIIVFAPAGELVPAALRNLRKGGTLTLAGIYMTDIPRMGYEECVFYERDIRSVTANTRKDGEDLLRVAAEIPIRPKVTSFRLDEANAALRLLKSSELQGTGVLVM